MASVPLEEKPPLTTTSYAVLSLLALRPWTAYELAKQVERSLHWFWPRAERKLYDEPKKLVLHGFAAAARRRTGRRWSTDYSITPAGRHALRAWVRQPGASGPTLEFEALLRVFASDSAGADDLRRLLEGVRTEMAAWQTFGNALGREIGTSGGPFPSRVHVNALVHRFLSYYVTAVHDWAEWALDEVKQWETTEPDEAKLRRGRAVMLIPVTDVPRRRTTAGPVRARR